MIELIKIIIVIGIGLICVTYAWWITMDEHHKEVLGGDPQTALKKIIKYKFFNGDKL